MPCVTATRIKTRRDHQRRRRIKRSTTNNNIASSSSLRLALVALVSLLLVKQVDSLTECRDTSECVEWLRFGSECIDGYCTNPFQGGCLRSFLGEDQFPKLRTCNSEDPPEIIGKLCIPPPLESYQEIRILSQNWESAFFTSWLYQIVLSEMLGVPTTIETGTATAHLNFYDPDMPFDYGKSNLWDALKNAHNHSNDCVQAKKQQQQISSGNDDEEEYIPCGHINPEVWQARIHKVRELEREGYVEPPEGCGMVGGLSWFIPKFTAERDSTLSVFTGLSGEKNRRKLAKMFKRPTSWGDYCHFVSKNNCSKDDGVAVRYPESEREQSRYYVDGVYRGFFRNTLDNDCDKFPHNCTGHIADFPCSWQSYVRPQTYHNEIFLQSSGTSGLAGGYSYGQLIDLWDAANATRENLVLMWWTPEALYQKYLGTDAEFIRVQLPPPSQHCVNHRIDTDDRCDIDPMVQVGDPDGACGDIVETLLKVVVANLYDTTYVSTSEAMRSPAYDAIKAFRFSELQIGEIFDYWMNKNLDKWNYDPREAVCRWAAENIDTLQSFIPRSFPREFVTTNIYEDESGLFISALTLGCISLVAVIITMILTFVQRERRIMVYAKVSFLFILLVGLFLVSCGSILLALEPNNISCQLINWFLLLGYTMELVPLIVKVAALQKLIGAAKRMKRIAISQKSLVGSVVAMCSLVIVFLIFWTVIDPSQVHQEYELTTMTTTSTSISSNGTATTTTNGTSMETTIVLVHQFCRSESNIWRFAGVTWHTLLLFCATILAFQTRHMKRVGFNESQLLAVMIYSHFMFVLFRLFTFLLENVISAYHLTIFRSYIYSIDAIICIAIYFIPKFTTDDNDLKNGGKLPLIGNMLPGQDSREETEWGDTSHSRISMLQRRLSLGTLRRIRLGDGVGNSDESDSMPTSSHSTRYSFRTLRRIRLGIDSKRELDDDDQSYSHSNVNTNRLFNPSLHNEAKVSVHADDDHDDLLHHETFHGDLGGDVPDNNDDDGSKQQQRNNSSVSTLLLSNKIRDLGKTLGRSSRTMRESNLSREDLELQQSQDKDDIKNNEQQQISPTHETTTIKSKTFRTQGTQTDDSDFTSYILTPTNNGIRHRKNNTTTTSTDSGTDINTNIDTSLEENESSSRRMRIRNIRKRISNNNNVWSSLNTNSSIESHYESQNESLPPPPPPPAITGLELFRDESGDYIKPPKRRGMSSENNEEMKPPSQIAIDTSEKDEYYFD